jgi:glyceraldehyde-3-phosphate dehydrogenase (NADP+)
MAYLTLSLVVVRKLVMKLLLIAIADQLAPILVQKIEALQVGSPLDGAFIGPLISEGAAQFVQTLIDDAINKGGKVLTGNKVIDNLVYPTLIDNVTNTMQLFDEEPFGPLLPIIRNQRNCY